MNPNATDKVYITLNIKAIRMLSFARKYEFIHINMQELSELYKYERFVTFHF